MNLPTLVAWSLAAFSAVLVALGVRAFRTLREGRGFQEGLSRLSDEELHRFLASPRGSEPGRPADILYRLNALMEFGRRGDPRKVPLFIALLADEHPSVVAVCHEALREMTGVDFRDPGNDTRPDPAAWRAWWESREGPRAAGTPPP